MLRQTMRILRSAQPGRARSSLILAAIAGVGLPAMGYGADWEWKTTISGGNWDVPTNWTAEDDFPKFSTDNVTIAGGRAIVNMWPDVGTLDITVDGSIEVQASKEITAHGSATLISATQSDIAGKLNLNAGGTIATTLDIASGGEVNLSGGTFTIHNATVTGAGFFNVKAGANATVTGTTTTIQRLNVFDFAELLVPSGATLGVTQSLGGRVHVIGRLELEANSDGAAYLGHAHAVLAARTTGPISDVLIAGFGKVEGDVELAELEPTNDVNDETKIGTLSILGNFDLASSLYFVDVDASGNSDRLVVDGDVELGGDIYVRIHGTSSAVLDSFEYVIIETVNGGQLLGDVTSVWVGVDDDNPELHEFALALRNDNTQLVLTAIPEPSLGLLLLPLTLLARRRR